MDNESKDADIGADNVATMVESKAARNVPHQILPMTRSNLPVLGSSASGVRFSSWLSPASAVSPPWLGSSLVVTLLLLAPKDSFQRNFLPRCYAYA